MPSLSLAQVHYSAACSVAEVRLARYARLGKRRDPKSDPSSKKHLALSLRACRSKLQTRRKCLNIGGPILLLSQVAVEIS